MNSHNTYLSTKNQQSSPTAILTNKQIKKIMDEEYLLYKPKHNQQFYWSQLSLRLDYILGLTHKHVVHESVVGGSSIIGFPLVMAGMELCHY